MKKQITTFFISIVALVSSICLAGCNKNECKEVQLMGAGDRIHDTYTFANTGVKLKNDGNNKYTISGSVDYLANTAVKEEFNIADDVSHVVALKITCCSCDKVDPDNVTIEVDGTKNYDAQHLNGSNYTFIILQAKVGTTTTISAKWNKDAKPNVYTITFANDLVLKENSAK